MISRRLLMGGTGTIPAPVYTEFIQDPAGRTVLDDEQTYKSAGTITELNGVLYWDYTDAESHGNGGIIKLRTSPDYGGTWTPSVTIASPTAGRRLGGGGIMTTDSDRLVLTFHDASQSDPHDSELNVIYSDNAGSTWSSWYQVPLVGAGMTFAPDQQYTTGPALQLPNGDILIPCYGEYNGVNENWISVCYQSTNNGATFPDGFTVATTSNPNETSLNWLGGEVVAFCRSEVDRHTHRATSTDFGETWSALTDVAEITGRPLVGYLAGGLILVGRDTTTGTRRRWRQSWDLGLTWGASTELDPGDNRDAGYAALWPISSSRMICLDAYDDASDKTIIYQRYFEAIP